MSGVQCECGRFLANVYGIFRDEHLSEVRGDCSRCGKGVLAKEGLDCWWWNADLFWVPERPTEDVPVKEGIL